MSRSSIGWKYETEREETQTQFDYESTHARR